MPIISERDLSVFISLLAAKIRQLEAELQVASATDEPSDAQIDAQVALQETLEHYALVRDGLRDAYEEGLQAGANLPSFDALTRAPGT